MTRKENQGQKDKVVDAGILDNNALFGDVT